jgi:hypothetical protein
MKTKNLFKSIALCLAYPYHNAIASKWKSRLKCSFFYIGKFKNL